MTKRDARGATTFALLCSASLLGLSACGGGGGSTSATPVTTRATAARQTTLVNAARGTLTVVLTALETASYYGNYIRPGVGLALGAIPAATQPVCNGATHTASTSFPNQTGTATLVTTAFYPANDATCSQSPFRVLVMQYALGASQTGYGYQVTYSSANDPLFGGSGVVVTTDAIVTTIYKSAAGAANVVASIAPNGAQVGGSNGPPAQPPPGLFPATFPANFPLPPAATPFGFFFATAESGATSTTNAASLQGVFPAPPNFTNGSYEGHVASSDRYAVTASAPSAAGSVTLSLVDGKPLFVADVSNAIVPTIVPGYPFASGATNLALGPSSPLGYRSTAANLPGPVTGSATVDASGTLVACSASATDPLDGVRVDAACANGGTSIALTVSDLLAKTSAIVPATVTLDTYGFSLGQFHFAIDGSIDSVAEFVLQ